MMQALLICRVIDNLGDAGVCLRLALGLRKAKCAVQLWTDQPATLSILLGGAPVPDLEIRALPSNKDIAEGHFDWDKARIGNIDFVVEPFGSSADHTESGLFSESLATHFPDCPWLVLDYLSAEDWVEAFHAKASVNPRTGHTRTYFYPGFTLGTGGLIHCDLPAVRLTKPTAKEGLTAFVMCYPQSRLKELTGDTNMPVEWKIAGDSTTPRVDGISPQPFVPLTEFDQVLLGADWAFVRGEDSFVRAQLLGLPMVWQIYPTTDGAHEAKLRAFFDQYVEGLDAASTEALWHLWALWNGLLEGDVGQAWERVALDTHIYEAHAQRWRARLLNQKELVGEILTWVRNHLPTNDK